MTPQRLHEIREEIAQFLFWISEDNVYHPEDNPWPKGPYDFVSQSHTKIYLWAREITALIVSDDRVQASVWVLICDANRYLQSFYWNHPQEDRDLALMGMRRLVESLDGICFNLQDVEGRERTYKTTKEYYESRSPKNSAIKERTKDVVDEDNIRKSDNTEPVSTETVSVTHSRCDRE